MTRLHAHLSFSYWDLVWLGFPQVCACCHNCKFLHAAALLCLEDILFLELSNLFSEMIPECWEEGVLHLGQGILIFASWSIVVLYANHHLLHIEASLAKVERFNNLWT